MFPFLKQLDACIEALARNVSATITTMHALFELDPSSHASREDCS